MVAPPAYLPSSTVDNRYVPAYGWPPCTVPQTGGLCPPTVVGTYAPGYSSNNKHTTTFAPVSGAQTRDALASQPTITHRLPFLVCPLRLPDGLQHGQ